MKKRILILLNFFTLLFVGLLTPFFTTKSFGESKAISILKETTFYSVKNKYYRDNKEFSSFPESHISKTKNITQEHLDSYISVTSDKLQAELLAASASQQMIDQIVGIYLGNVLSYNPQDSFDYPLSQQEILNYKYSFVKNEAEKLNVDVIDFYNYYENVVFETLNNLTESNNFFSNDKDSSLIIHEYLYDFWKLLDFSQKTLPSEIDFTISLYNLLKKDIGEISNCFSNNSLFSPATLVDPLPSVLKYAQVSLRRNLNISENAEEFLFNLKDYSDNTQLNSFNISVGNEIPISLFPKFLNYKYNLTTGADFKKYKLSNVLPIFNSSYDEKVLDFLFVDKEFDGFSSWNATYAPGEIYPGYTLHLYMNDIDETSDSHECTMSLIFGVSETKSSNNLSNILWDTSDYKLPNKTKKSTDANNVFSPIDLNIQINSPKLIRNISKNLFSKIDLNWISQVWVKKEDFTSLPSGIKVCFNDSVESRPSFENILDKYKGPSDDTYDLRKYPIILSGDDINGISLPKNIDLEKFSHKHQKIVLVADDVDTNNFYFVAHWAIVDFFDCDQLQNNSYDNKNFIELQSINWAYNDDETKYDDTKIVNLDSVNIPYKVSEETKALLERANTLFSSLKPLYVFSSIINSSNDLVTNLIKAEKKQLDFENALELVYISSAACLLIDAFSCFMFPIWTAGKVFKLIIVGALLVSAFVYASMQADKTDKVDSAINSLQQLVGIFDKLQAKIFNCFTYVYTKNTAIIDSHSNFEEKIKSATEVDQYYEETVRPQILLPLFDVIKKSDKASDFFCVDEKDITDIIDQFEEALKNETDSEHRYKVIFPFILSFYIFDNFAEVIKDVSPFTNVAENWSEIKGAAEKWINPEGWRSWKIFKPLQKLKVKAIERLASMFPNELERMEALVLKIEKALKFTAIFQVALMVGEMAISYYEEQADKNVTKWLSLIIEELNF